MEKLHINFYEDNMGLDAIEDSSVNDAKSLISGAREHCAGCHSGSCPIETAENSETAVAAADGGITLPSLRSLTASE